MPDSLFGGGGQDTNGAPTNIPITAVMPPYMKGMNAAVMPNAPNQLPQLARDMAAGGFVPKTAAGHKAALAYLTKIYQPAQTYNFAPPTSPKPVVKPKTPVTPPVTPASPSGLVTGYKPDGTPIYGTSGGGRNSR